MSTSAGGVEEALSISEVAERFCIGTDTLGCYEKAKLIAAVGRSSGNHRRYATAELAWIEFLLRLRDTGMPARGDSTIEQRLTLLEDHHAAVEIADQPAEPPRVVVVEAVELQLGLLR